jgi:hypothetical protein
VCNKYQPPKTEDQIQEERVKFLEDVSPVQLDDENRDGEEAGPSKKSKSAGVNLLRQLPCCSFPQVVSRRYHLNGKYFSDINFSALILQH